MNQIWTDGSCEPNPGTGGWGYHLRRQDGAIVEDCGGMHDTTNNRMELTAVIEALAGLPPRSQVAIYTDSQYVKDGITRWIHGWKRRGWKTADLKPVKNVDLWERLDALTAAHRVKWHWVRSHSGNAGNERADVLAGIGREKVAPALAALKAPARHLSHPLRHIHETGRPA